MEHTQYIYIKMKPDLREQLRGHYEAEADKHEEGYSFSQHVRQMLRSQMAGKARKPKAAETIDLTAAQIVQRIAVMWDEEMPSHVTRMGLGGKKRKESVMVRWKENNDFECWRMAIRALSKDEFHTKRKNFTVEYLLRPSHFQTWLDHGEALKNQRGASDDFLDILQGIVDDS